MSYYLLIRKNNFFLITTISIFLSIALFLTIYPSVLVTYTRGMGGIEWARPYIAPNFFIPYFFGTHLNKAMTLCFLALSFAGMWYLYKSKVKNQFLLVLFFAASFSLISTLIYSYFFTTIFHLRSLQIVALAIVVIVAFAVSELSSKLSKWFLPLFCLSLLMNSTLLIKTIDVYPGQYLLQFFPWRNVIESNYNSSLKLVKYKVNEDLPTPILLWGLKYTLKGRESYPIRAIKYGEVDSDDSHCKVFHKSYIDLYRCD